jgi:ATP-dependent exoDNAse (exonuclease V) beta subunit
MSPLHIYRASAGSGKTFALTLEYLKLMFRSPGIHRRVLAVTFTNRAAGEMKQRILGRLHLLAGYEGSGPIEEMDELKRVSGLSEEGVKKRAGELLNMILNDYSWFSVGTIDKFFQSVIRAFTREAGIQPGYNLELDHHLVLVLAIDRLFQKLGEKEELQQWLIRFAEERLEESRSWNFRRDMVELGLQLFRESFQELFLQHDLSVLEKKNLGLFQEDLENQERKIILSMTSLGEKALKHIGLSGYSIDDFKGKGRSHPSLFLQAAGGEAVKFTDAKIASLDQLDKWLNKGAGDRLRDLTTEVLIPMAQELFEHQRILNTIVIVRQNLYTLGILIDIWEEIQTYTGDRNLFLIADSSRFLKGIIGGNQVPFIYEKTGNRYSHLMLDEFQDTSVFQYDNFRPLLDHALAGGYFNLAVGDVKQSIYRWRNSDWNLLSSDLESDFSHQKVMVHQLDRNFRSREQIVRFNNTVFQLAPDMLSGIIREELMGTAGDKSAVEKQVERFRDAYADAVQQIPGGRVSSGGAVRIEFFREQGENEFREAVLHKIPDWIREIRASGIKPGEIAILVRNRKEGSLIAAYLLDHFKKNGDGSNFRLVSSESLLLLNNRAVVFILSLLRYLIFPDDPLNNSLLKYHHAMLTAGEAGYRHSWFDSQIQPRELLGAEVDDKLQQLKTLPLYELVESLIHLFGLYQGEEDLPYLQALQDIVIDLQRREPLGIGGFLHYWEQHGSKKGVNSSEDSDAIKILTIHKAKGLEFNAVIVPYCFWEITTDHRKSNILWCSTEETPFDRIPVLPVRFSRKMQHTLFSSDYYEERMKGYMDNLNLLYVAFTRARDALFIGIPERDEPRMQHVGDLVSTILPVAPAVDPSLEPLGTFRSGSVISVGELPSYELTAERTDPWHFTVYPVAQRENRLKIRSRNDEYYLDGEGSFQTGRMYGNIMHMIFSRIKTISDVDEVISSFHRKGVLPGSDQERISKEVMEMISSTEVEEWFSGDAGIVYNERSLFCGSGRTLRPDRVMIKGDRVTVVDFKFGGMERAHYRDQVSEYMQQLSAMGYVNVNGYLWYASLGKIIQIPPP